MAKIKIHGGDFLKSDGSFILGQFSLKTDDKWVLGETISASELSLVQVATEENIKKLAGTLGWGIAGGALFGPIGLLAGLVLGKRFTNPHLPKVGIISYSNGQEANNENKDREEMARTL